IPGGKVLTGVAVKRGNTITSATRSHLASADRKSRLYCAIPPRPPNASVTSARTRSPDLVNYAPAVAADTWKAHRLAHAHLWAASEGTRRHSWMRLSR